MRSVSPPPAGNYIVFGHPFALSDPGDPHDAVPKVTSPVALFDTHPLPATVRANHDPEKQIIFYLPHDPVLANQADEEGEPAKGLSGCGLWHVIDVARLIGIFSLQCVEKEYLVGTSLKCVLDSLAAEYPDLQQIASTLAPLDT